jgi:hypothetical protein
MNQRRRLKIILGIPVLACAIALLIWAFLQERQELMTEKTHEHSVKPSSHVSFEEGERSITVGLASQLESGIVIKPVESMTYQERLQAYGKVLDLKNLVDLRKNLIDLRKNLIDLRNGVAAAEAQVEKARVSLDASHKEYERLRALYEDSKNVSEKVLQAGEVTWRSDEANARAAQQSLHAAQEVLRTAAETLNVLEDGARQEWGNVLTLWLFNGTSDFERLLLQQDVLIQITLPPSARASQVPETVSIQIADGRFVSSRFVSRSPRTDPRIQGMSFLYVTPAQMALLPGMNVVAWVPIGSQVKGFYIPGSAIVWWQGKAWVYVQRDEKQFVRQKISTEIPANEGYFVVKGLRRGERMVVKGAQVLLSEEFRVKTQPREED